MWSSLLSDVICSISGIMLAAALRLCEGMAAKNGGPEASKENPVTRLLLAWRIQKNGFDS